MAKHYKPITPFDVPMRLLIPTTTLVKGSPEKTYPNPESGRLFFGSFRTFGGTENFSNDIYTIFSTATIETWYNPQIKSNCQIYICNTGDIYNVISEPENIGMRNQYMQFKVEKIGGKA